MTVLQGAMGDKKKVAVPDSCVPGVPRQPPTADRVKRVARPRSSGARKEAGQVCVGLSLPQPSAPASGTRRAREAPLPSVAFLGQTLNRSLCSDFCPLLGSHPSNILRRESAGEESKEPT